MLRAAQSSILSIGSVSVALLWGIFLNNLGQQSLSPVSQWSSLSPLGMPSYCCSSSIFFSLTTLFSYPLSFSLFHAPLDVVVYFLIFLRSFRFQSFLSQFSPFVAQIKNFCSDPGFFLLTMFAKDLTGCFNHCCVEGGDHWMYVCIFVAHDGERCKPPAYHSLEGFQHVGIFQLSEVKLESCVLACWFFFRRMRKVIISKSWSLLMSAPEKLRVLAMFTSDRKRFITRM